MEDMAGPIDIHDGTLCDRVASCSSFSAKIESSRVVGLCPISAQPSDSTPH